MRQTLLTILLVMLTAPLFSQNLMLEVFSGANITAYDTDFFEGNSTYFPIGARIAGGLPNVQLGAEYHTDLQGASFDVVENTTDDFENSYYGGFVRANISPNPAYGFGIVLKAGAGIYSVKETVKVDGEEFLTFDFDNALGFNGGIGFSIPIANKFHLEAGYIFNFVEREYPRSVVVREDYNAFHHSFQLGFSYNFLFGEAAKRYDSNKRWKNGWRGAAGKRYKNWKG